MENIYVLLGLLSFVGVAARASELYFSDRREQRQKDQKQFDAMASRLTEFVAQNDKLDEHVRERLMVFQRGLENAISQFKTVVSEMDAARQKANAANVLNKLQGKRPLP